MTVQEILEEYRKANHELKANPDYNTMKQFYYSAGIDENLRKHSIVNRAKAFVLALDKASADQQDDQEIIQALDDLLGEITFEQDTYDYKGYFTKYAQAMFENKSPEHILKVKQACQNALYNYGLDLAKIKVKLTKSYKN